VAKAENKVIREIIRGGMSKRGVTLEKMAADLNRTLCSVKWLLWHAHNVTGLPIFLEEVEEYLDVDIPSTALTFPPRDAQKIEAGAFPYISVKLSRAQMDDMADFKRRLELHRDRDYALAAIDYVASFGEDAYRVLQPHLREACISFGGEYVRDKSDAKWRVVAVRSDQSMLEMMDRTRRLMRIGTDAECLRLILLAFAHEGKS
jgi:hypothetical protein